MMRRNYEGSKLIGSSIRNWWIYKIITPIEVFCLEKKITPDQITIFGFLLNIFAAFFFYMGYFFLAGLVIVAAGNCDFLDGKIARETNWQSKYGAFLDSVIDRYIDGMLFIGLAGYFRNSWVLWAILFAILGTQMVSYTKARGEALGITCNIGIMQRPERILYLGAGAIITSWFNATLMAFSDKPTDIPQYFMIAILLLISILSNYTAIQRSIFIIKALNNKQ